MIDTHAHLDACAEPPAELLARARAAGVDRVITIGSGIDSCEAALRLAAEEKGVVCALGIHPHQAGTTSRDDLERLEHLLGDERAVAVGETGLDYFRDYAPRERQREIFRAQIALATKLSRPLVVHSRAADEDTLAMLEAVPAAVPVVLHCFSSPGLLPAALERGYYVSFAGNLTYPKAVELREAAAAVDGERLLVETDCPYLSPQPVRGRPNEPAHVVETLAVLASTRGEEVAALVTRIDHNADAAFGLP